MSNWSYSTPMNIGQPGTPAIGGVQALQFRDPLDARRAMQGNRIPQAEYPDGYLGTLTSRRDDRVLNQLKKNLNQRSYQRGVHKGEKIDPADYLWPPEFGPMSGLERQLTGLRAAPLMTVAEQMQTYGAPQVSRVRGVGSLTTNPPNPQQTSDLRRLGPSWK